jgi:hypothetical protein
MDTQLAARALSLGGVFSTADATSCGVGANELAALERSAAVMRVGPRAFVTATAWQEASTPEQRHRLSATAVLRSFDGRVVASHHSALAVHDLPFWRVDEQTIHVARRRGTTSRRRGQLRIHEAFPRDGLVSVNGFTSVCPALAVVGTAMVDGFEAGLTAADAALHRETPPSTSSSTGSADCIGDRAWRSRDRCWPLSTRSPSRSARPARGSCSSPWPTCRR